MEHLAEAVEILEKITNPDYKILSLLGICKYRLAFFKFNFVEAVLAEMYLSKAFGFHDKDEGVLLCLSDCARQLAWLTATSFYQQKADLYLTKTQALLGETFVAAVNFQVYHIQKGLLEQNVKLIAKSSNELGVLLEKEPSDSSREYLIPNLHSTMTCLHQNLNHFKKTLKSQDRNGYLKLAWEVGLKFNSVCNEAIAILALNGRITHFDLTLEVDHNLLKERARPPL